MSIVKRLRMIYAAITQRWVEEACDQCGETWWADARHPHSGGWCMTCEDAHFESWKREYELRQEQLRGDVA